MSAKMKAEAIKKIAESASLSYSPAQIHQSLVSQRADDLPDAKENALHDNHPDSSLGHDFADLSIRRPASGAESDGRDSAELCPSAVSNPHAFPFGSAYPTSPAKLQTKLVDNHPKDEDEEKADKAAEQIRRKPAPSASGGAGNSGRTEPSSVPPIVHEALRSPGRPLDPETLAFMEPRFGHDFSQVRVHADAKAAESARAVDALAYTLGRDVVSGVGVMDRRLLAHELTHVVQQRRMTPPGGDLSIEPAAGESDAEADRVADAVVGADRRPVIPPAIDVTERKLARKGRTFVGFFANIFQFWDYSPETLEEYLKVLDDTQDIEDDDDSDDKARQVVRDSKSGKSKFKLTQLRKALLIREMLSGRVLGSDQEGILTLLNGADSLELSFIFGAGGVRHKKLLAEFDVHKKELMDFYRRRFDISDEKDLEKNPEPLQQPREKPKGPELSFNEALEEGANVLHKAEFGKVGGTDIGPDKGDGYDAREWKEIGREKLVATVEPWLAFHHLLKNLGKDVPSSIRGKTTKWSFDCFGFAIANMIYAYWRTLTREDFNKKFTPLELGMNSLYNKLWEKTGPMTTRPGEQPFAYELGHAEQGISETTAVKTFNKPMKKLLEEAPIGSKVIWSNLDALSKCGKNNWALPFCNFANENTIKLGQDKYSAHDLGVVNEDTIRQEMAKAVFPDGKVPKGYIERNIYISSILHPKEQKNETT